MNITKPWASFCMSTYKRPEFLKSQIETLLKQTFTNFEIVIADNDPNASGKKIVDLFNDNRINYQCNIENLGMVKSFNRAIERANGEFVVMVTDDDPVFENMLQFFFELVAKYPNFSFYAGVERPKRSKSKIEIIERKDFATEILNTSLTKSMHWSSCLIKKSTLEYVGKLADFGSGHLVDHIMITLCGSYDGAVLINEQFSKTVSHDSNYSKSNINNYYISCINFYDILMNHELIISNLKANKIVIKQHLKYWFINYFFQLRKYYFINKIDIENKITELDNLAEKILELEYMKHCRTKYFVKKIIFGIKKSAGILK